jgi:hypothetical protein
MHRVWRTNEVFTKNFVPAHGNEAASFVHCIMCEDMELPPAVDPIPSELKAAAAVDRSEPFTTVVTIANCMVMTMQFRKRSLFYVSPELRIAWSLTMQFRKRSLFEFSLELRIAWS